MARLGVLGGLDELVDRWHRITWTFTLFIDRLLRRDDRCHVACDLLQSRTAPITVAGGPSLRHFILRDSSLLWLRCSRTDPREGRIDPIWAIAGAAAYVIVERLVFFGPMFPNWLFAQVRKGR